MSVRSIVTTDVKTRKYQPEDIESKSDLVAIWFESLRLHHQNKVEFGVLAGDPTTPSAQATGTGNTLWNINLGLGQVTVNGVIKELAAEADHAIHTGSLLTGLTSGKSCRAVVYAKNDGGTVSLGVLKGTAATTGQEVAPTDAQIQTEVGAGVAWIRLAECVLNRTGDVTVTQTQDNSFRPVLGVNVDLTFGNV